MIFTFHPLTTAPITFGPIIRVSVDAGADLVAHMTEAQHAMSGLLSTPGVPPSDRVAALERYLPFAYSLIVTIETHPTIRFNEVLTYTWNSLLHKKASKTFEIAQKYYDVSQLISAIAGERVAQAAEAVRTATSKEEFCEAAKVASRHLREAAGLFDLNAERFLCRWNKFPSKRPSEVLVPVARACALVCIAQAEELVIKKGVIDGSPLGLLVRLLLNVVAKYEAARELLRDSNEEDDIDPAFAVYIAVSAEYHRAVALRMVAESFAGERREGVPRYGEASTLIDAAKALMAKALKHKLPDSLDELRQEIATEAASLDTLHAHIHKENDSVYFVAPIAMSLIEMPTPRELSHPIPYTLPDPVFSEL